MTPQTEQEAMEQQAVVEAALRVDREAALRDVFAAAALGALITRYGAGGEQATARAAYSFADAMMKARKE